MNEGTVLVWKEWKDVGGREPERASVEKVADTLLQLGHLVSRLHRIPPLNVKMLEASRTCLEIALSTTAGKQQEKPEELSTSPLDLHMQLAERLEVYRSASE